MRDHIFSFAKKVLFKNILERDKILIGELNMDENIKNRIKYLQDNGYKLEEEFQTDPLILNE